MNENPPSSQTKILSTNKETRIQSVQFESGTLYIFT